MTKRNPPDKKKKNLKKWNDYILPTTPGTKPLDVIHKIKIKHKDDERVINTMELVEENYRLKEENEAMHQEIHTILLKYWNMDYYKDAYDHDELFSLYCKFCEEEDQ